MVKFKYFFVLIFLLSVVKACLSDCAVHVFHSDLKSFVFSSRCHICDIFFCQRISFPFLVIFCKILFEQEQSDSRKHLIVFLILIYSQNQRLNNGNYFCTEFLVCLFLMFTKYF